MGQKYLNALFTTMCVLPAEGQCYQQKPVETLERGGGSEKMVLGSYNFCHDLIV